MKVVFNKDDLMNKKIYAVTRLSCGYGPTQIIKDREDKDIFEKFAHYHEWNAPFWDNCFHNVQKNHIEM